MLHGVSNENGFLDYSVSRQLLMTSYIKIHKDEVFRGDTKKTRSEQE
jgi:hypothetical protein